MYVLVSKVKSLRFYGGMSEDAQKRLKEHTSGKTKSTKGYIPWELFFFEKFYDRNAARDKEKYLKSGSGKESIKNKWSRSLIG
ncbi:MAG: GIY-YIG nuclease family protein [Bacteroidia bacterium]